MKCLIQCTHSSKMSLIGTWDLAMEPNHEDAKCWVCDVNEEGVLIFPDELWEQLGWKIGDDIEFVDQDDGSFILRKVDPENNDQDS